VRLPHRSTLRSGQRAKEGLERVELRPVEAERAQLAASRRIVMPVFRAAGQAQYVDEPIGKETGPHVDDLAREGAMSTRTLNRRFQRAVGIPPGEWLQRERPPLAQRLLEMTDAPLPAVARRAGYESATTMRAHFASRLRTSPRAYRRTFRG
jgi:AraC family transcriptional activator FtrA